MFFWVWLSMSTAFADVMLRTGVLESKKDAERLLSLSRRILKKEKLELRSSRFLVPRKGYRYRVLVDGISTEKRAEELAKRLGKIWSEIEMVTADAVEKRYITEDAKFVHIKKEIEKPIVVKESKEDTKKEKEDTTKTLVEDMELETKKKPLLSPQTTDILSHAEKSLLPITQKWEESTTEKFVFHRILKVKKGETLKARHVFHRKGEAMKLELEIEEGEGEDSTTLLTPSGKGVLLSDGESIERSALRTKEVLNKFSSKQIFSILLNFSKDVNTDGPWRELRQVEKVKNAWRLFQDDDSKSGTILQAIFTDKEGWLLQIVIQDSNGRLEYRLTEYTDLGDGTHLPFRMEKIRNGELEETVIVENLFLGISISDKIFSTGDLSKP